MCVHHGANQKEHQTAEEQDCRRTLAINDVRLLDETEYFASLNVFCRSFKAIGFHFVIEEGQEYAPEVRVDVRPELQSDQICALVVQKMQISRSDAVRIEDIAVDGEADNNEQQAQIARESLLASVIAVDDARQEQE